MKRQLVCRGAIFLAGMVIVSLGITCFTKSGLGISPMTAVPYALARSFDFSFSTTVFVVYTIMVFVQILIKGKNRVWWDLLQIPSSILFTSFLRWFEAAATFSCDTFWQQLIVAVTGSILNGIGFAMMVDMQLVPNPPDGLIFVVSNVTGKNLGFWKNVFDSTFVILAGVIDILSGGKLVSIGIGTVLAMIVTGRMVALTNRLFKEKMLRQAGMAVPCH